MLNFNPFRRVKPSVRALNQHTAKDCQNGALVENQLEIKIENILVKITRCSGIPPQNELSAFIPRAEIRRRRYENGLLWADEEIILSSITLVDAPRHPPEQAKRLARSSAPAPPEVSFTYKPR